MSSKVTRALTIAAALCGFAFARPGTVHAPAAAPQAPARLLHGLEVPTDRYLDLGAAPAPGPSSAGYVAAPAVWQVERGHGSAPAPRGEHRYLDVGALGLVRATTESEAP